MQTVVVKRLNFRAYAPSATLPRGPRAHFRGRGCGRLYSFLAPLVYDLAVSEN